jgi:hypothetical protein
MARCCTPIQGQGRPVVWCDGRQVGPTRSGPWRPCASGWRRRTGITRARAVARRGRPFTMARWVADLEAAVNAEVNRERGGDFARHLRPRWCRSGSERWIYRCCWCTDGWTRVRSPRWRSWRGALLHSELVTLPDVGHLPFLRRPMRCGRSCRGSCCRCPSRAQCGPQPGPVAAATFDCEQPSGQPDPATRSRAMAPRALRPAIRSA